MPYPKHFEPRDLKSAQYVIEKAGVGQAWRIYANPPITECMEETKRTDNEICSVVSWIIYHGRMTHRQKTFLKRLIESREADMREYRAIGAAWAASQVAHL